MTTSLTYRPDKGVSFDDTQINWGFDRLNVRHLLGGIHRESNSVIDISEYNNGSKDYNIVQRRDIYQNYGGQDNFFFLNYDKDDFLKEIEIHKGIEILIGHIKLVFDTDFRDAVSLLKSISSDNKQISHGEYFFKDLKLTIADSESMGGDGEVLAYFYCSQNVNHLNDE